MFVSAPRRSLALLLLLCGASALGASAQVSRGRAADPTGHTVALAAGSCPQIADGDTLIFDWNPAFDHIDAVRGLQDMTLLFAPYGQEDRARRGHAGLLLHAVPPRADALSRPASVTAQPGGSFQIRLQPDLSHLSPGEYRLTSATAQAAVDPGYSGPMPAMTNSPAQSFFCLTLTASTPAQ